MVGRYVQDEEVNIYLFYVCQDQCRIHMIMLIYCKYQLKEEIHFENRIVYDDYRSEMLDDIRRYMILVDKMEEFYKRYLLVLELVEK